jgi:GT2 family glycosyltransferase
MKTICYIIGYRGTNKDDRRYDNLIITLTWLIFVKNELERRNDNITLLIIVVEQDAFAKLVIPPSLSPHIQQLFIHNNGFYNRGWAFNVGYKLFFGDYYFFADCDIIMDIEEAITVFETCFEVEAVNPYAHIFDSTKEYVESGSEAINALGGDAFNPLTWKSPASLGFAERMDTCFSGGIVGISEHAFSTISGWDERFRGRGWEDYAFSAKINLFLYSTRTYDFDALHVWHPFEIHTTREINIKINEEYKGYGFGDYMRLVEGNNAFGLPTKYSMSQPIQQIPVKISERRYRYAKRKYYNLLATYGSIQNVFFVLCEQVQYINENDVQMWESGQQCNPSSVGEWNTNNCGCR